MMTKMDYAEALTNCEIWDGEKDPQKLAKLYTKEQLKDYYDAMEDAIDDYYENR